MLLDEMMQISLEILRYPWEHRKKRTKCCISFGMKEDQCQWALTIHKLSVTRSNLLSTLIWSQVRATTCYGLNEETSSNVSEALKKLLEASEAIRFRDYSLLYAPLRTVIELYLFVHMKNHLSTAYHTGRSQGCFKSWVCTIQALLLLKVSLFLENKNMKSTSLPKLFVLTSWQNLIGL